MTYHLAFGSYVFPDTFSYAEVSGKRALTSTKLVRFHGSVVPTAWQTERTVEVRGGLMKASIGNQTALEDQRDALRAALAVQPANLYLTNGRYLRNARVDDAPESTSPTWMERMMDVRIRFVSGDPFFYDTSESSDNTNALSTSPGSVTIATVGGNVFALPQISLTVAGSGAVSLDAEITNTTTGDLFTLVGDVNGGDVIVIDSLAQTVKISGIDRMDLFDKVFPTLAVGSNAFTVEWSSGGFTNMAASWRNRYL